MLNGFVRAPAGFSPDALLLEGRTLDDAAMAAIKA